MRLRDKQDIYVETPGKSKWRNNASGLLKCAYVGNMYVEGDIRINITGVIKFD
jgi:hypothetical protein